MKIKESPLKLMDIFILNSKYEFLLSDDQEDPTKYLKDYPVDIDFTSPSLEADKFYRLFMKIEINWTKDFPGHSLQVEGVGIFTLDSSVSEQDKVNLLTTSAISMLMNSLRGYISNMTSYTPFGRYVLPSISVHDLIIDKKKEQEEYRKAKEQQDKQKEKG